LTAVALFIVTRLDDTSRSIPLIHFLVLGGGLIGVRALARLVGAQNEDVIDQPSGNGRKYSDYWLGAPTGLVFFQMVEELGVL